MPSSYVYLSGQLDLKAAVAPGGSIAVLLSDNNGLDWKDVARIEKSGFQSLDLGPLVYRRYDYRLKFVLSGKGTGLESLRHCRTTCNIRSERCRPWPRARTRSRSPPARRKPRSPSKGASIRR